jgi:hypothetical protein
MSSTSLGLGPQHLLARILGDEPVLGDSVEDANANLQVLMGYWNTLLADRKAGGVRLAPLPLAAKPTRHAVIAYSRRRHEEILWFVRGIDAGGGDPMEFGDEGRRILIGIAQGDAHLESFIELLVRETSASPSDLQEGRAMLLALIETIERLIGDLLDIGDAVRREALRSFSGAGYGRPTLVH